MTAIWGYDSSNEVFFDGITDEAGNLYWIERAADGAGEVVSFDWDGLERWRAAVPGRLPDPDRLRWPWNEIIILVAGDHVVLRLDEQDGPTCARDVHLIAFRASSGTVAWKRTLGADIPPDPAFHLSCTVEARQPAAAEDALFVSITRCTRIDDCRSSLEAFEIGSGVRRFAHPITGLPSRPAVDESGNVYVVGTRSDSSELLSVAPFGAVRRGESNLPSWSGVNDIEAVASGVVLSWGPHLSVLEAASGDLVPHWELGGGPAYGWKTRVAISGTALFGPVSNYSFGRWRLGSTYAEWHAAVPGSGTGPLVLTSAGTLVFTGCVWPGPSCAFSEMDVAGYEHHRVPLPAGFGWGSVSLHNGRWILGASNGVRSFDLPGRMLATKGWVSAHGSLAGDRRAR